VNSPFGYDLNTPEGRAMARAFANEILAEVERFERRNWKPTVLDGGRQADFIGEDMTQCPDDDRA
jgi:hypothetical protein